MTAVCLSNFLKRRVIIGSENEQSRGESVHRWGTNGLTVSRYVQNINREKGQRSSSAVQSGLKFGKRRGGRTKEDEVTLKPKYVRVRFNSKDGMTLYNLYTSKVCTKFEIQLPIVIHRVIECQGENA